MAACSLGMRTRPRGGAVDRIELTPARVAARCASDTTCARAAPASSSAARVTVQVDAVGLDGHRRLR